MMVSEVTETCWLRIIKWTEHIYKCAFVGLSHKYKTFSNA